MLGISSRGLALSLCAGALLAVPSSASAAASCSYAPDHTLTVTTQRTFSEIIRSGDSIQVSDSRDRPLGCAGGSATVSNTDLIHINHLGKKGAATFIELGGGPFAPGATLESDASSEIEFDLAGAGFVEADGTPGPDVFRWGPEGGLNLNSGVNGDLDVDVSASNVPLGFIIANGGRGPDVIEPQADYSGFFGVFDIGGPGNDRLIASPSGDILYGGSGSDLFRGSRFEDDISGGTGRDRILSGGGTDEIGVDDGTRDRVSCGGGHDYVVADPVDKLKGCETVLLSKGGKAHRSGNAPGQSQWLHLMERRYDRVAG